MEVVLWLHPLGVELHQESWSLKKEDVLLRPEHVKVQGRLQTCKRRKKRKIGAVTGILPILVDSEGS